MAKSHKRGGQKKHNKRLQVRNEKNYAIRKKVQQQMSDFFQQSIDNIRAENSGVTKTEETT